MTFAKTAPEERPSALSGIQRKTVTNAMSVDVEDYFQVSAFADQVRRERWDDYDSRVERNTEKVLGIFSDHNVRATFFTLGWVAERYPRLIQRIVEAGHELGSHGYAHFRVYEQNMLAYRQDVRATKRLLEDVSGCPVRGYRAASFSIDERTLWALEVLAEEGYEYSSSIYPIRHDHYGMPNAPRFPFCPLVGRNFREFPLSTVSLFNQILPCGGGGYFRVLPYRFSRWAIRRVNDRDGRPCIFYFHPWELDAGQPRIQGISMRARFRHYTRLSQMEKRLRTLLTEFAWDRIDQVNFGEVSA